jgi:hypothetical protein
MKREFHMREHSAARTIAAPALTPDQQRKQQEFRDNARDIAAPATPSAQTSPAGRSGGTVISDKFAEALKARAEQKKKQQEKEKDRLPGRYRGPRHE